MYNVMYIYVLFSRSPVPIDVTLYEFTIYLDLRTLVLFLLALDATLMELK